MAFHPFHWFRKHQKVIFAGLTIMTMIVFVASFGPGDLFSRGNRGARQPGKYVTTLYGRKVYEGDLWDLSAHRGVVNDLLIGSPAWPAGLIELANSKLNDDFQTLKTKMSGDLERPLNEANSTLAFTVNFVQRGVISREKGFQDLQNKIMELWQLRWTRLDNPESLRLIDNLLARLQIGAYFLNPERPTREMFFGGSATTADLLDFMIWQHQADRLGISLPEAEVLKVVNSELGDVTVLKDSFAKNILIRRFVAEQRRDASLTEASLLKALTEEVRVQMARRAILGQEVGFRGFRLRSMPTALVASPAAVTPAQFVALYQDKRTTEDLAVLDLPVASFKSQVATQPTETALLDLFNKYRDKEPDPRLPRPGFRRPQRASIAYFSAPASLPYFQERARALVLMQSLQPVLLPLGLSRAGGGIYPLSWVQAVALRSPDMNNRIPSLQAGVLKYQAEQKDLRWEELNRHDKPYLLDSHVLRPQAWTFAAVRARMAGAVPSLAGMGDAYSISWAVAGAAAVTQQAERAQAEKPFLTATAALIGQLNGASSLPLVGVVPWGKLERVPLSVAPARQVAPLVLEEETARLASTTHRDWGTEFQEELKKQKDARERKAFIKKEIQKLGQFGWVTGSYHQTSQPEDRYQLDDDRELEPLKQAFERLSLPQNPRPTFGEFLLARLPSVFEPVQLGDFWCWKTENIDAWTPGSLDQDEVRKEVKEAWLLDVARVKAREKALEITRELKNNREDLIKRDQALKNPWLEFFVRQLAEVKSARVFSLDGVTRLVNVPNAVFTGSKAFKEYQPPRDKIDYAVPNFGDKVLDTLKERGEAMVLPDRPQKHFYVLVATARIVPAVDSALDAYAGVPKEQPELALFWKQVALESIKQTYMDRVMTELRVAAAGTNKVNDGQIILPDGIPNTFETDRDNR